MLKLQKNKCILNNKIKNKGSLEGESPQGFLRAQNPKLS